MKRKFRTKKVWLAPYLTPIDLIVASDMHAGYKHMVRKYWTNGEELPGEPEKDCGLCRMENGKIAVLVHKSVSIAVLVHECVHAICFCLGRHGITFDGKDNEVLAYPVGYLVGQACNFVRSCRRAV